MKLFALNGRRPLSRTPEEGEEEEAGRGGGGGELLFAVVGTGAVLPSCKPTPVVVVVVVLAVVLWVGPELMYLEMVSKLNL